VPLPVDADTLCSREPIPTPGSIQPHGALLALDPLANLAIVVVSANLHEYFPSLTAAADLFDSNMAALFSPSLCAEMHQRLRTDRLRGAAPWQFTWQSPGISALDIAIHAHAGLVLVEVTRHLAVPDPLLTGRQLEQARRDLNLARNDLAALGRATTAAIRALTGYERVLIYRFDADWHGQAISEDKTADWAQSLDGLHFPAGDIPAQARALYRITPLRWVPDRDAAPVGLLINPNWQNPARATAIDLSFARLRSQSPAHLQYHRHMGVNGALSISIMQDEELWGLIVCHHRLTHYPDPGALAAAAALAEVFALRMNAAEQADTEQARRTDLQRAAKLLTQMAEADRFESALATAEVTIADLFACNGAAVLSGGEIICLGDTPPAAMIGELARWLSQQHAGAKLFQTENMSANWPGWAPHAVTSSGILAVFLGGTDMLLWFRPEEPHLISWGGNPYDSRETAASAQPRRSFERWVDTRHGFARPWLAWELEIAESLRHGITDLIVRSLRRIAELNERLRQAQKMEAVGQLTGGIAHDFNNLLAGVTGSLELIQSRIAHARFSEIAPHVTAAMRASARATALVNRLLSFSRRQTLDPRPVNLEQLVPAAVELIGRAVGPAIAVTTMIAEDTWMAHCDANELDNALLNLAINARDAMPHGGSIVMTVENIEIDDATGTMLYEVTPGQYVLLSVIDTGAGMSAEIVSRVFEPFFTTKPLGEGTGLGLSMVYGFVKQSHGHIGILSVPGQGTTVKIYLPRHHGAGGQELQLDATALLPAARGKGTILIVDDEQMLRVILIESLTDQGYAVRAAQDGATALEILQSPEKIDLLITDVGLPGGLNGRQLADAAHVFLPALAVLFITGYAEHSMLPKHGLGPRMEVMAKPFALDALALRIRAML
jgi:light-regulated signal transduction histidine kinase (bacteriophytochrome)/CheY-like chemotaxis protein